MSSFEPVCDWSKSKYTVDIRIEIFSFRQAMFIIKKTDNQMKITMR